MYLRDLRGDDEESVAGTDTWSAIALIDRLLVSVPGAACEPGAASTLAAADRDRLLAGVLQHAFGDRITSTVRCDSCGTDFDLEFRASELVASQDSIARPPACEVIEIGTARLRIPSGTDELAAAAAPDPVDALMRRCLVDGEASADAMSAALETAAPLLDLDLDARCASCGVEATLRFNVQHYLLGALLGEHRRRISEIHRLGRSYRWSLGEILSLPRAHRRDFVAIAERERGELA